MEEKMKLLLAHTKFDYQIRALLQRANLLQSWDKDTFTATIKGADEVRLAHPAIIPIRVSEGVEYDAGITGSDWVAEHGNGVNTILHLGRNRFGKGTWKIVLVESEDGNLDENLSSLKGTPRIITEFPGITSAFFKEKKRRYHPQSSRGSSEGMVSATIPLGVCVSHTGKTLENNKLRVVACLMEAELVLIANPRLEEDSLAMQSILQFADAIKKIL
jgi:ATP phosphoribosyltransferase